MNSSYRTANLKEVQQVLLDLLNTVVDICEEHNVTYWLDGGTLLGARRSGSFIAWDDDLDICFPFNEYLRLRTLLEQLCERGDHHILYSNHRDIPYWSDSFGTNLVLKEGILPVEIDLVYAKSLPETAHEAVEYDRTLVNVARRFTYGKWKGEPTNVNQKDFSLAAKRIFMESFCEEYLASVGTIIPNGILTYAFNDMLVAKSRPWYKYEQVFPLSEITFEGRSYNCPANVDEYLTVLYGISFMEPPPLPSRQPASTLYLHNEIPQQEIERWLWRYELAEQVFYRARMADGELRRKLYKIPSITQTVFNALVDGDWRFVYRYLRNQVSH